MLYTKTKWDIEILNQMEALLSTLKYEYLYFEKLIDNIRCIDAQLLSLQEFYDMNYAYNVKAIGQDLNKADLLKKELRSSYLNVNKAIREYKAYETSIDASYKNIKHKLNSYLGVKKASIERDYKAAVAIIEKIEEEQLTV